MAFSQTQLDSLEAAIAQGALTVKMNDRLITYHSFDQMMQLRDQMQAELGVTPASTTRSRFVTVATGKGL